MTVPRDELAREMAKEAGWLDSGSHAIVACSTVAMLHVERARAEALEEAAAVAEYHGDWAIAQDIIALKDKDGFASSVVGKATRTRWQPNAPDAGGRDIGDDEP